MTELRERMMEDMQLRGLSAKTQEAYLRAVRQLADHYGKSPEQITEEELRQYFLYLKNEKRVSWSTCTQALCGIKFFFQQTCRGSGPPSSWCAHPRSASCRWCSAMRNCDECWARCAAFATMSA